MVSNNKENTLLRTFIVPATVDNYKKILGDMTTTKTCPICKADIATLPYRSRKQHAWGHLTVFCV